MKDNITKFEYHPEVINHKDFTPTWFGERCAELLASNPDGINTGAVFGFDRQIHRWYTDGCDPEEYIQVWMTVEVEESEEF